MVDTMQIEVMAQEWDARNEPDGMMLIDQKIQEVTGGFWNGDGDSYSKGYDEIDGEPCVLFVWCPVNPLPEKDEDDIVAVHVLDETTIIAIEVMVIG